MAPDHDLPESLARQFAPRENSRDARTVFYEMGYAAAIAETERQRDSKLPSWIRSVNWMPLAASVLVASTLAFFAGRRSSDQQPSQPQPVMVANQTLPDAEQVRRPEVERTASVQTGSLDIPDSKLQQTSDQRETQVANATRDSRIRWFDWSTRLQLTRQDAAYTPQDTTSMNGRNGWELASHGWRVPAEKASAGSSVGLTPSLRASDRFDADGSLMN